VQILILVFGPSYSQKTFMTFRESNHIALNTLSTASTNTVLRTRLNGATLAGISKFTVHVHSVFGWMEKLQ
jgi:hypothetical protein